MVVMHESLKTVSFYLTQKFCICNAAPLSKKDIHHHFISLMWHGQLLVIPTISFSCYCQYCKCITTVGLNEDLSFKFNIMNNLNFILFCPDSKMKYRTVFIFCLFKVTKNLLEIYCWL